MQARKRMRFSPRQQVVFFKACARTWMGEHVFDACTLPLTLAQGLAPPVYSLSVVSEL